MSDESFDVTRDFQAKPPHGDFTIKKIYCKDISFETPNSPAMFQVAWKPNADVQLRTNVSELAAAEYEVVLAVTVTVLIDDTPAFLAEVKHAGIFGITGLTSDELGAILGSYCPSILFPFSREVIADLITRGGFPQFVLAPVNFEALYAKHLGGEAEAQPGSDQGQS
jgi:preprotein translocase subunit SecB